MKKTSYYYRGAGKFIALFVLFLIIQETLALFFPLLLKDITNLINNDGTEADIIRRGALVLGVVITILIVNVMTEYFGSVATEHYSKNLRRDLYDKVQKVSSEGVNEIGSSQLLPMMANDSKWLKAYQKRIITFIVYFPVAILGSFIMLFSLEPTYALIAFASVPISLLFFFISSKKLEKPIEKSIVAFDDMYRNVKEGIAGAKEIRIQNKAEERTADFNRTYAVHRRQAQLTDRALNLSVSFNALLYTVVTIAVIICCAYIIPEDDAAGKAALVTLNACLMYVNKIWTGSHYCFQLFVDYIPRCKFTVMRYKKVFALEEENNSGGGTELDFGMGDSLKFARVSYKYDNNARGLTDINMEFAHNTRTAIVGAIGSGKNLILNMLLRFEKPTDGTVFVSGMDAESINAQYWRKNFIAVCAQEPQFIPGTVRDNLKLLNPSASDEQILGIFAQIGALDFIKKFDNFLDYQMGERSTFSSSVKNLLNVVRTLLKPAQIYIFHLCFEHIKHEYIDKIMAKLSREKKSCIFITHKPVICKKCDNIYILKGGRVSGSGKHTELLKNADYQNMLALSVGQILADEVIEATSEIQVVEDSPLPAQTEVV